MQKIKEIHKLKGRKVIKGRPQGWMNVLLIHTLFTFVALEGERNRWGSEELQYTFWCSLNFIGFLLTLFDVLLDLVIIGSFWWTWNSWWVYKITPVMDEEMWCNLSTCLILLSWFIISAIKSITWLRVTFWNTSWWKHKKNTIIIAVINDDSSADYTLSRQKLY